MAWPRESGIDTGSRWLSRASDPFTTRSAIKPHTRAGAERHADSQSGSAVILEYYRGMAGGSWTTRGPDSARASFGGEIPGYWDSTVEEILGYAGFRIAQAPEPATIALLALGGLLLRRPSIRHACSV